MRAIGIVLAGGNSKRMRELSNKRAIAAMPIAGSFRSVDFALSNMSNSHIQSVAVLTQYNSRSLNEHLSSSKWWDFGRKQGGMYVFTPTITAEHSDWYRGTADALYQNLDFLKKSHEPYVVIAAGDGIYKLDYNMPTDGSLSLRRSRWWLIPTRSPAVSMLSAAVSLSNLSSAARTRTDMTSYRTFWCATKVSSGSMRTS